MVIGCRRRTGAVVTLLSASLASCTPSSSGEPMNGDAPSPQDATVIPLDREEGMVIRLPGSEDYAVSFSVAGTIDSTYVGLVSELDGAFRQPGLRVRVTGRLRKEADLPPPVMGGQEMFRLEIEAIERIR